jgi:hypothetical protein
MVWLYRAKCSGQQSIVNQLQTTRLNFRQLLIRLTAIACEGEAMTRDTKSVCRKLLDKDRAKTVKDLVRITEDGVARSQEAQTACEKMAAEVMQQKIGYRERLKRFIMPEVTSHAGDTATPDGDSSLDMEVVTRTCKCVVFAISRFIALTNFDSNYLTKLVGVRRRCTQSGSLGGKGLIETRTTRD